MIYHRPLRRLVRYEVGGESRFAEERGNAFAAIEFVVLRGVDRRKYHRHALVGGVALRYDVAEHRYVVAFRKLGVGSAIISVQLPVGRARRLAYNQYVYLAAVGQRVAPHAVRKFGRGAVESVYLARLRDGESEIVAYIHGENLVAQHMTRLAAASDRQYQTPRREDRAATREHRLAGRGGQLRLFVNMYGGDPQQRQIDRAHGDYGGIYVAQQLCRLARVGRHQVQKHVGGNDRVAEQIRQHYLERAEKYEYESPPDHASRPSRESRE